jgi:tRNA (guanine-N7-)-methyltransferase
MLKSGTMDTYTEVMEKVQERKATLAKTCAELFPDPCQITFETGCGHGHFLAAYAESFPHERCLGIDLVTKRIEKAANKATKRNLSNLSFLKADLFEFLEVLPAHIQFQRVFMLFPDPWPKKRHHRKRMLNHNFLETIANRMSITGDLCFRTDHPDLFEWAMEHIESNPYWEMSTTGEWPFEHSSFFQDLMESWQSFQALPTKK